MSKFETWIVEHMDPHLKPIDFVGSVLVCMLYISCVYSRNEFLSDPLTLSGILAVHWIYIQLRIAYDKKKGRRLENNQGHNQRSS